MSMFSEWWDDRTAAQAGTADAEAGVDASNVERLLDAWVGQVQRADPENDLAQRRASFEAQRARNDLAEAEDERRRHERGEESSVVSPALVSIALGILFVIETVGATIMLEGIGIPLRHRLAFAVAYSIGMLVVTRITAWLVEVRKLGPLGWLGAGAGIVLYTSVIVLGAAARFLVDEEDLSLAEFIVEGMVACVAVLGPAIAMHAASVYYLRARPTQNGRRAAEKREAKLTRALKSAHETLERAQREVRDREARRVRMKASYLAAHRRELARIAQMNELIAKSSTVDSNNPERSDR